MKILFIVSTLQMGGAERVVAELANRWVGLGHSISLLTLDLAPDFFKLDEKITRFRLDIVRKSRKNPIPHIKMLFGIKRVAKEVKPDYVISMVGKTNIFTLLALGSKKYKVVVCEQTTINQDDGEKLIDFFRLRLYHKAYKATVLSKTLKKDFLLKYPKCKEESVIVHPNALNVPSTIQESNLKLKDICNAKNENTKIIISLGRFSEVKRFDLLIKIFAQFYEKYCCNPANFDARLILFGGGDEKEMYINLISKLNREKEIIIHERVDNVFSVLAQADVLACTSKYEGLSMSMLEAFYAKVPVIAFDVPGFNEVIINEKTGILVENNNIEEYANSLHKLLTSPNLYNEIIGNAKIEVKNYLPEKNDERWFNEILV